MTPDLRYSRRHALWLSAGLIVSCADRRSTPDASTPPTAPPLPGPAPLPTVTASATPAGPTTDGATPSCLETRASIQGPYYRPGAPERANLVDPGLAGTPVEIQGFVMGLDCKNGLAGVELDIWHATHEGHYDNDGTMRLGDRYLLRGLVRTDAQGRYRVSTIVPGRYLNGAQYRPSHVHVKIRGRGFKELTTQLYFPGDPYNDIDPFIHRSLIMSTEKTQSGIQARYDFVLRNA